MDTQLARPAIHTGEPSAPPHVPPQALGLALATMEGLLGRRSLHQLRPWMSSTAFLQLVCHVDAGRFGRSRLGRLRLQMPSPTAMEATAGISLDQRWLACTVRLDREESWICSEVIVLGCLSS